MSGEDWACQDLELAKMFSYWKQISSPDEHIECPTAQNRSSEGLWLKICLLPIIEKNEE